MNILFVLIFGLSLALSSCSSPKYSTINGGEMGGSNFEEEITVLYVDPATVKPLLSEFKAKLRAMGPRSDTKRALYEEYVPKIGANGVLQGITELWPSCHSEAHDLGRVIEKSVGDIDTALRVCRDGCFSGCMHGVLMEAYAGAKGTNEKDGHVEINADIVQRLMTDMCESKTMKNSYSPGDCAHATGHALMVLSDYEVGDSIEWCDQFQEEHMRYYCATGAYMEYITEKDQRDVEAKRSILYPCERYKYPAACARYKMVHVIPRLVRKKSDFVKLAVSCQRLKDPYRIGCFHGLGNGLSTFIAQGKLTLMEACGNGTEEERIACIDGMMERFSKYNHEQAEAVCKTLSLWSSEREECNAAVARGMYDMNKDLSLYVK